MNSKYINGHNNSTICTSPSGRLQDARATFTTKVNPVSKCSRCKKTQISVGEYVNCKHSRMCLCMEWLTAHSKPTHSQPDSLSVGRSSILTEALLNS